VTSSGESINSIYNEEGRFRRLRGRIELSGDGYASTMPYLMIISEMPTTPCLSTSSATENALCSGVFSGIICSNLRTNERQKPGGRGSW
jgi:hypothetical protein